MSLKSWREEFYPINIEDIQNFKELSEYELIQISLTKWLGLLKENLDKHDVDTEHKKVFETHWLDNFQNCEDYVEIAAESCSLCVRFLYRDNPHNPYPTYACFECPLYKALGDKRCDDYGEPFHIWICTSNPEPMIKALEKALSVADDNNESE